jgi:hypothetical protein
MQNIEITNLLSTRVYNRKLDALERMKKVEGTPGK